jgi:hypothetical protein
LRGQPAADVDPDGAGWSVAPVEVAWLAVALSPPVAEVAEVTGVVGVVEVVEVVGVVDRPGRSARAVVVNVPDELGAADRDPEPVAGAVSRACCAAPVAAGTEVADRVGLTEPGLVTGRGAVNAG